MSPDLNILAEFVSHSDQWERTGGSLDQLLAIGLPPIQSLIPETQAILLHRVNAASTETLATTQSGDRDDSPQLNDDPAILNALANSELIIHSESQSSPLLCLWSDDSSALVLELAGADKVEEDSIKMLQIVASRMGAAINAFLTNEMIRLQIGISKELAECVNFREIVSLLGKYLTRRGQFISINLTRFDLLGKLRGFETVATANRNNVFEDTLLVEFEPDALPEPLKPLTQGEDSVFLEDMQTDPDMSKNFREWNASSPIRSIFIVPMRFEDQLFGIIALNSIIEGVRINQQDMTLLQGLAAQIGVLVRLHNMTQEISTSYNVSERQALVFGELGADQDIMKMAEAFAKHMMVSEDRFMTLYIVESDASRGSDLHVLMSSGDGGGSILNWQSFDSEIQAALLQTEVFVVDRVGTIDDEITRSLHDWLIEQDIESFITVPIHVGGQAQYLLAVSERRDEKFTVDEIRAYRNIADQMGALLHNQNLLMESLRAANRLSDQVSILQTINQLGTQLASLQDERQLLDETCAALHSALGMSAIHVALWDETRDATTIISEYPATGLVGKVFESDVWADAAENDEPGPLQLSGHDELVKLPATWRGLMEQNGVESVLLLPLMISLDEPPGIIALGQTESSGTITPDKVEIARTVAGQVSVTLQNIRLLHNTQRQALQLDRVASFSEAIQATLDLNELLDVAMATAPQILTLDHMTIAFYDPSRSGLFLAAWQDKDGMIHVNRESDWQISDPAAPLLHVWNTRSPLQVRDLHEESAFKHHQRDDVRSLLTLPIFSRGNAHGVIEIGSSRPGGYSQIDVAVFQQLVSQLSVAIENAEAYTQSRRLAMTKALAADISNRLSQEWDMEQILTVTLSELGRALGARKARIRMGVEETVGAYGHDSE